MRGLHGRKQLMYSDSGRGTSPGQVRRRSHSGGNRPAADSDNEWYRMNEGFDGFDLETADAKRRRKTKTPVQEKKEKKAERGPSTSQCSQLSINWDSSDDEIDTQSPLFTSDQQAKNIPKSRQKATPKSTSASRLKLHSKSSVKKNSSKACTTPAASVSKPEAGSKQKKYGGTSSGFNIDFEKDFKALTKQENVEPTVVEIDLVSSQGEGNTQSHEKHHLNLVLVNPGETDANTASLSTNPGTISQYESDNEAEGLKHTECMLPDCEVCKIMKGPEKEEIKTEPGQEKKKASDWADSVQKQFVSPDRSSQDDTEMDAIAPDSSKKKKTKYVKDGLAERLQRLRVREKSAHTFWSHKLSAGQSSDVSRILRVSVLDTKLSCSLLECECVGLSHQFQGLRLMVLFSGMILYKIKRGAIVHIHPPWQKLRMKNDRVVILCTKFSEVYRGKMEDPEDSDIIKKETQKDVNENDTVEWRQLSAWECPCVKDPSIAMKNCPAEQEDFIRLHQHSTSIPTEKQPEAPSSPNSSFQHHLETVESSSQTLTMSQRKLKADILASIEQQGHVGLPCSFVATVQRVVKSKAGAAGSRPHPSSPRLRKKDPQDQTCLILQDKKGVICELQVTSQCTEQEDWASVVENGVGKVYAFKRLKVVQRTNRARHSGLFSMIDSIWNAELCSQGTQSQDSAVGDPQPPVFCYILKTVIGESHVTESSVPSIPHREPHYTDTFPPPDGRCSIKAKLLYTWKSKSEQQKSGVHYTMMNDGSVISLSQNDTFLPNPGLWLRVQDAVYNNGKVSLDHCSSVQSLDSKDKPTHTPRPMIRHIDSRSELRDLVTVQGTVSNLNEDTAYTWLVCDRCGSEKLSGGTAHNPFLHCNICQRAVTAPVSRMRLEIAVETRELQSPVKIQLLQGTIEKLLPQDENADEGYEVSSVLGKAVGPIHAVITHTYTDPNMEGSSIYELEEIDLKM